MSDVSLNPAPRRPLRDVVRAGWLPGFWRDNKITPDESWHAAVNEAVVDAFYDEYRLRSPDGWDSWHDADADRSDRPTEEDWEVALYGFYDVVREIDVYSPDGRDGSPMFAGGFVRADVKDAIPGYRDWEAVVAPAYDARLRASQAIAPVNRAAWLDAHPVSEFLSVEGSEPERDESASALGGMRLDRSPESVSVEVEPECAVERQRMADVALDAESAAMAAWEAEADRRVAAMKELNERADEDELSAP